MNFVEHFLTEISNTIFGRVKYIILCNIFKLLLDTMGAILKCYLLFVFVFCAFMITMGAMFNVFTIAAFPTCISQRIQHTIVEGIGEVFEGIGEKMNVWVHVLKEYMADWLLDWIKKYVCFV